MRWEIGRRDIPSTTPVFRGELAIARALAMQPTVMLFDEATSALDPTLAGEVLAASGATRELLLLGANPRLPAFVGRFKELARLVSALAAAADAPSITSPTSGQ